MEIVTAFNSELRGFANYYGLANGVKSSLGLLELETFRSLAATLASRHRTTARRVKDALRKGSDYGVSHVVRGKARTVLLWRLKHLEVRAWFRPEIDTMTVGSRLAQGSNDLATRLQASACEACGTTTGPFEMHHVRRLKDLRSGPFTPWKQAARRRKTVVLCRPCHLSAHGRRSSGAESRVH